MDSAQMEIHAVGSHNFYVYDYLFTRPSIVFGDTTPTKVGGTYWTSTTDTTKYYKSVKVWYPFPVEVSGSSMSIYKPAGSSLVTGYINNASGFIYRELSNRYANHIDTSVSVIAGSAPIGGPYTSLIPITYEIETYDGTIITRTQNDTQVTIIANANNKLTINTWDNLYYKYSDKYYIN
jgi:hypothetical protein